MTQTKAERSDPRLAWYRRMIEIRLFEEKVQELFMDGLIQGTTHLCQGQEAVSVGAVAAMRADDVLTNTYRGHGHALARGMTPETAFAEMMGRSTGGSRGVGGAVYLVEFTMGNNGPQAVLRGRLPVARGAGRGLQIEGQEPGAPHLFWAGASHIATLPQS